MPRLVCSGSWSQLVGDGEGHRCRPAGVPVGARDLDLAVVTWTAAKEPQGLAEHVHGHGARELDRLVVPGSREENASPRGETVRLQGHEAAVGNGRSAVAETGGDLGAGFAVRVDLFADHNAQQHQYRNHQGNDDHRSPLTKFRQELQAQPSLSVANYLWNTHIIP